MQNTFDTSDLSEDTVITIPSVPRARVMTPGHYALVKLSDDLRQIDDEICANSGLDDATVFGATVIM